MGTLILMSVYLTLCLWRHRISQILLQPEVKVMIDAKDVYCRFCMIHVRGICIACLGFGGPCERLVLRDKQKVAPLFLSL